MVVFQFSPLKYAIQTWFCNCPQYLYLFHIVFEYIPGIHDQGKMLVLPPHRINVLFLSSLLCHPHTQIRIILFDDVRISIPNLELSPSHSSIGSSQIAFPTIVPAKGWHTDFAQEERLGLPYWTMILATCVVVDESKCLDIPILEFSIILEHLPSLPGYKQILHPLLVLRTLAIWRWYPWSWRLSFEMLKILVLWILHKNQNHLSQDRLGVQLDLCIFGALPPIRHFSNDRCPSVRQNELLRPTSLLHRWPLSYFWLLSGSTPKFSPIFPIPCPLLPLLREFSWLGT